MPPVPVLVPQPKTAWLNRALKRLALGDAVFLHKSLPAPSSLYGHQVLQQACTSEAKVMVVG